MIGRNHNTKIIHSAMLVLAICLLFSVSSVFGQYESVLCVCKDIEDVQLKGDVELCGFQHGYITRGNEFVTLSGKTEISIVPIEHLKIADTSVCGDDEDRRRFLISHSTSVDSKGGVSHSVDVDAHVGKYGVSGGVSFGQDKVEVHGSVGAGLGSVGASYEHSSGGHKFGVSAGISDPTGSAGANVHGSYSSGSGFDGGVGGHVGPLSGTADVKGGTSFSGTLPGKRHASIKRRMAAIKLAGRTRHLRRHA